MSDLLLALMGDEEKQTDAQSKFSPKSLLSKSVKNFKYVILTDSYFSSDWAFGRLLWGQRLIYKVFRKTMSYYETVYLNNYRWHQNSLYFLKANKSTFLYRSLQVFNLSVAGYMTHIQGIIQFLQTPTNIALTLAAKASVIRVSRSSTSLRSGWSYIHEIFHITPRGRSYMAWDMET